MLSTLGDKIPRKAQVRVGYDPGSVWGGIAIARQVGLVQLRDPPPEGPTSLPDIEVLLLEVWNLKEGKVLRPDADWNPVWDQLPGFSAKSDKMLDWARAIRALIERCPLLHEVNEEGQLPAIITEQQCDGALSHWQRTEITRLSEQFRAAIDAADEQRGHTTPRVNRSAASKYLLTRALNPNDREQHKKDCQAIQLHLLEQLGLEGPLKFMRAALSMRDVGQIHDMCDALGLAIQDMLNHTEAEARAQVRELQAIIRQIPRAPKQRRKKGDAEKKQSVKKPTQVTQLDLIEDSSDEDTIDANPAPPKKRTPKKAATPKKGKANVKEAPRKEKRKRSTKKAQLIAETANSGSESDEASSKPKKRTKTDNDPVLLSEEFFATAEENCQ